MYAMRAAIMGAGLSGLCCAYILEKYGYHFDIYENRSCAEDRFADCEMIMELLNQPVRDIFSFLAREYGLYLKAANVINKIVIKSQKETAEIPAFAGYITVRGNYEDSLEKQLASNIKRKIYYGSEKTLEELKKYYDYVVLASGDGSYTENVRKYTTHIPLNIREATIEGDFDPHTVIVWLNNNFAPQGYSYLIPFNQQEANIAIIYPDYEHNKKYYIDRLWDNLLNSLNFRFHTINNFLITDYKVGIADKLRADNILFAGNCYCSGIPFLGFGQVSAILSGIYAGLDICEKTRYESRMRKLKNSYYYSLSLKREMEKMNNKQFDKIVKLLRSPLGRTMFHSKGLSLLKYAAAVSSILTRHDSPPSH